ncbi:MAG: PQQ-binding-like beta-propeller repeat protein, partial [Planctomycetaceae bacterium]
MQTHPDRRSPHAPATAPLAFLAFLLSMLVGPAPADLIAQDWPMFGNSPSRHGSTTARVDGKLEASWTYQTAAPPKMAWSSAEGRVIESKLMQSRTKYDDVLSPVVAGGRMYVGSSVDHHLHCIDLVSGKTLWSFPSGGPIRLAP